MSQLIMINSLQKFKKCRVNKKTILTILIILSAVIILAGFGFAEEGEKNTKNNFYSEIINRNPYVGNVQGSDAQKPLHRSLNTDYVELKVTYTSNTAPTVSNVKFNNGSDLTLTPDGTTEVKAQATVEDAQGCTTISTVEAKIYRSGATNGKDCSVDKNDCYSVASCTVVTSGNTCDGAEDTSADYECTINMEYYADPTDAGSHSAENWRAWVKATDDGSLTDDEYSSTGTTPDVKTQLAFSVSPGSIDWDPMNLGDKTTTGTNKTVNIINTGNVQMDVKFDGTDMSCSPGSILVGNLKYGESNANYDSLAYTLSGTPTERDWNVEQRTDDSGKHQGQDQKYSYWGIEIPATGVGGSCSGTATFTAVEDQQ